ncbi:MAG: deoxyribose-phosphate aldolase [Candidatus Kapabacteria bacterium]|nr:deoxyribose-phosphate aldolase [Candidatus Kapabacteria bacterium]
MQLTPQELARTIDHTLLKPDGTAAQIEALCAEAVTYGFASVCVLPWHVRRAASIVRDSSVAVCTVVGFPLGATYTDVKIAEAMRCMDDGALELDMVINISALKSGDVDTVLHEIRSLVTSVHDRKGIVKVIIETCVLTDEEKRRMCSIVTQAGADFIKTSTGFSTGGATVADVLLMRDHVGPGVSIKASGGIRETSTALSMLAAGASRLGTSSGVAIVRNLDQ